MHNIKPCQKQLTLNCVPMCVPNCVLITNVCKSSKNFDFPETEQLFRFVWFEEFPRVCYSWWEDRTYCLPCVLFGHKYVGKSLQKKMSKMANSSKNIKKKHRNVSTGTHKKGKISFHRSLGEYTLFLTPSFF